MADEILVVRCGTVPYAEARELQGQIAARRQLGDVSDVLLLLEHPPVYTRGRRSQPQELPMGAEWYEAQGIEVRDTDRGGLVTYHGPGQLVAYPIVGLAPYDDDVHEFVRGLERATIAALGEAGVAAQKVAGLTGIWTLGRRDEKSIQAGQIVPSAGENGLVGPADGSRKIGSIGLHVSRGVTTHGLAINVNNDLQPFQWVVPCGIEGVAMTSLARELGAEQDFDTFAGTFVAGYAEAFEREPIPALLDELGLQSTPARLD